MNLFSKKTTTFYKSLKSIEVMKNLLLLFIALQMVTFTYAQTLLDTKKVPEVITKKFTKTYKNAQNVKWFSLPKPDKNLMVKFTENELEREIVMDPTGKEVSSRKQVDFNAINPKIIDDIHINHKDKTVEKVTLITKGTREKYYNILMMQSQGRKKEPLKYEIEYTFNGVFITLYEPEDLEKAESNEEVELDKMEQRMEKETEMIQESGEGQKISKSDLPSPAVNYIKDRHGIEYKYKEISIINDDEMGEHYKVIMKKQGEKKLFHYYFDTYGKIIKETIEEI
jgi:hypothetical protein